MPFVYKYIDKSDGIVKYVGIVCREGNDALKKRIKEHLNADEWASTHNWFLEYIEVKTKGDAHALEGHFIAYYKSYEWFNKAKSDYGLLSFINSESFEWKKFDENEKVLNQYYSTSNDFIGCKARNEMISRYISNEPKSKDEWLTQQLWMHREAEIYKDKLKETEEIILSMIKDGKSIIGRDIFLI